MRFHSILPVACAMSTVIATYLYATAYDGTITTLSLSQSQSGFEISPVDVNNGSPETPVFLLLDEQNGVLYCVEEGLSAPSGYLSSYRTSSNGSLTQIDRQATLTGPTHIAIYNSGRSMALAHYGGSGVSSWDISPDGKFSHVQDFTWNMTHPGPNAAQGMPHPHEVIVDPTGSYLVVPDLGADKLRVFSIEQPSGNLVELPAFSTPPGTGPRHGAFLMADDIMFLFLVSQLANRVTSYVVLSDGDGKALYFAEVYEDDMFNNMISPAESAAAEGLLSPDCRFFLTSTRYDNFFHVNNFDPRNSTKLPSDSLQVWAVDNNTGILTWVGLAAAQGKVPRQFSLNKAGTLVAVALQNTGVAVIERDPVGGAYLETVAVAELPNEVNCVVWDER